LLDFRRQGRFDNPVRQPIAAKSAKMIVFSFDSHQFWNYRALSLKRKCQTFFDDLLKTAAEEYFVLQLGNSLPV
jgi:hypothetical protein